MSEDQRKIDGHLTTDSLKSPSRLWLVKSGNRVFGPLTTEKIDQMLRTKEIGSLDEIADCFGRWHYIRDDKTFELTLNEIKNRLDATSDPATSGHGHTETDFLENTEVGQFRRFDRPTDGIQDRFVRDTDVPDQPSTVYEPRDHLSGQDTKTKTSRQFWFRMVSTMVLLVLMGGLIWTKLSPPSEGISSVSSLVSEGEAYFQMGRYEKARGFFESALQIEDSGVQLKLQLAPIHILEGDLNSARSLLNEILSEQLTLDERALAHNFLALADIESLNYVEADKNLNQSLEISPYFSAALFNKVIVAQRTGNLDLAFELLKKMIGRELQNPLPLLKLGELMASSSKLASPENISDLKDRIEEFSTKSLDYRQELLILRCLLLVLEGLEADASGMISKILDVDPDATSYFVRDLGFRDDFLNWEIVEDWITQIQAHLPQSAYMTALEGYSKFRRKNLLEGNRILEGANLERPNDSLILALSSYIHWRLGRIDEMNYALKNALLSSNFAFPYVLRGRFCLKERDLNCAKENYLKALAIDPDAASAIAGAFRIKYLEYKNTTDHTQLDGFSAISDQKILKFGPHIQTGLKRIEDEVF